MKKTSKATLARVNAGQPASLYQILFTRLLSRCQLVAPKHKFSFQGKLYLLDATVINLCLSVFPWAEFRQKKGAVKLHMGLDADGSIPAFMDMTTGKVHEINWAKTIKLPKGSFVCFDRGFTDYAWYNDLTINSIFFVTHLKAKEIAAIYKERWQIELFFKWIKQNLKIKTFLGTSSNAVLTQVWIALCVYLLVAYLNFRAKLGTSMQQILRVLQLNLFTRGI